LCNTSKIVIDKKDIRFLVMKLLFPTYRASAMREQCTISTALILVLFCTLLSLTEGHGHLTSPRSRNYEASEDGSWVQTSPGIPPRETCPHCLNTKASNEICGRSPSHNYDVWRDTRGNKIPWNPQATYVQGQDIIIESWIDTNHAGHIDVFLCPDGSDSTQSCFLNNPATMVQDLTDDGPNDPAWPGRGYLGLGQRRKFQFKYRLPAGIKGDRVMMQWRYVTANSCLPPGYRNPSLRLKDRGWLRDENMADCEWPLNWTGARSSPQEPEQFWNCAEIKIIPNDGSGPSGPSPPAPAPNSPPVVVPSPTPPTPSTPTRSCCSWDNGRSCGTSTWCNVDQSRCEGPCNGEWVTIGGSSSGGKCGCNSCTQSVLDRNADGYKVGARIDWLMTNKRLSERDACMIVCQNEFPAICSECIPGRCG